jgi:hypothetical protein
MSRSLIDLLQDPRIFARLTVTAAAASARALADGQRIAIEQDGALYWQYPDGRRAPVLPDNPPNGITTSEDWHG